MCYRADGEMFGDSNCFGCSYWLDGQLTVIEHGEIDRSISNRMPYEPLEFTVTLETVEVVADIHN